MSFRLFLSRVCAVFTIPEEEAVRACRAGAHAEWRIKLGVTRLRLKALDGGVEDGLYSDRCMRLFL